MPLPDSATPIEQRIDRWRSELRRRAIRPTDEAELEQRLRTQITVLRDAGLDDDEAFLVAARRVGGTDSMSSELARGSAPQRWEPHAVASDASGNAGRATRREAVVAFGLAVLAALAIKAPELFGLRLDSAPAFYARNLSLFVLPFLAGYFVWKRGTARATWPWLAAAFAAAAIVANLPWVSSRGLFDALTAIHLPIALWLAVGIAHAGGRWNTVDARMDFVRFSGELLIHYALIALGGIVLVGLMLLLFQTLGLDLEPVLERFILPCGAIGAVIVGSWLVEARQGVAGNIAPVLTRIFTPLFALVLLAWLATMLLTGRALVFERDLVIAFDLLLVVVLGLVLYSISARDPQRPAGALDAMQVVLVVSALLVDVLALWVIAGRITDYGFTPNRVAALGENLILLANLTGTAVLYVRFLRGRGTFMALERWQTGFLPVYAGWAAIVVVVFPLVF